MTALGGGDAAGAAQVEWLMSILVRFAKDESGATATEYGLIAAGISVSIIAILQSLGTRLVTIFVSISTTIK
jgi:pilus assembly protein Flp/PilA